MMQHCPNCGYGRDATNIFQFLGGICPECFGKMGCYTVTGRRVGIIGFILHQRKWSKEANKNSNKPKGQVYPDTLYIQNPEDYSYEEIMEMHRKFDEEKEKRVQEMLSTPMPIFEPLRPDEVEEDDFPYTVEKNYFDI